VDAVLGVSMAPTTVRVVLVQGEKADGATLKEDTVEITSDGDAPTVTAPDRVISAILSIRDNAAQDSYRVTSTGVTWADPAEAAALREGLAVRKIENVVLLPAFSCAVALAQAVGRATDCAHTALLYVEPDTATLAVVDTADGWAADVWRRLLPDDDEEAVAALVEMVKGADEMDVHPQEVVAVGFGVDMALIKPELEGATSLPVNVSDEPDMALARGAALAAAHAPPFAASTAALAQAVGRATDCAHTALLYVEPDTATLAAVDTADGGISDVRRRFLPDDDEEAVAALVEMVMDADEMDAHPQEVVAVGFGVDMALIKPELQAATSLPVSVSEEPEMALASAHASLFAPSTAGAYAYVSGPGRAGPYLRGEPPGTPILEARNLCKSYGRGDTATPILKNIDLRIFPGEFVALIGPSGSGKSTLLSILGLLEPPTSGDVLVNQQSAARLSRRELAGVRGRQIGYVFQSFNLLAGLSVAENVMLPSLLVGQSGRAHYDRAMALLDQFGLVALAKRVPAELSGGEQQRVAIARALFMAPDVVLADEPTGNLDTANGRKVIDTLYSLNSAGQTIVLVTHDRSIAGEAPRLVSLLDGRIETDTSSQSSGNLTWRVSH